LQNNKISLVIYKLLSLGLVNTKFIGIAAVQIAFRSVTFAFCEFLYSVVVLRYVTRGSQQYKFYALR